MNTPRWLDVPDAPGLWLWHSVAFGWKVASVYQSNAGLYNAAGPITKEPYIRWYGPIPEDTSLDLALEGQGE